LILAKVAEFNKYLAGVKYTDVLRVQSTQVLKFLSRKVFVKKNLTNAIHFFLSLDESKLDTPSSNNSGYPLLKPNNMRADMKFLLLCYISLSAPQIKSGSSKPVLSVPQD
jgi:hypothetical protein